MKKFVKFEFSIYAAVFTYYNCVKCSHDRGRSQNLFPGGGKLEVWKESPPARSRDRAPVGPAKLPEDDDRL